MQQNKHFKTHVLTEMNKKSFFWFLMKLLATINCFNFHARQICFGTTERQLLTFRNEIFLHLRLLFYIYTWR